MQKIFKTFLLLIFAAAAYALMSNFTGEPVSAGNRPAVYTDSVPQHRTCGTMEYLENIYRKDPSYRKVLSDLNDYARTYTQKHAGEKNLTLVTIPVVVHVVYYNSYQNISYDQIRTQIDVMNRDFRRLNSDTINTPPAFKPVSADPMIQFCLAQRDPNNNPTTGITRTATTVTIFGLDDAVKFTSMGGHDAWDRNKYLNLWVCNLAGGLLGYATFPGGNPAHDGVVIGFLYFGTIGTATSPYNLGRTATHEIGHWLQLYHIWGDDNGACTGSDYVDDTPNQGPENYGCPFYPHVSCSNGPNGDMFMNYMDYSDDGCMNIFTLGQSTRMSAALNGPRQPILTSNGCVPVSGVPVALFTADSTSIGFGGSVDFTDLSAGMPTGWNWTFEGGIPSSSTIQNPHNIVYSTPGRYSVKLRVFNSFGSDSVVYSSYIHVLGAPMVPFQTVNPPSYTRIITSTGDTSAVNFTWTRSSYSSGVTYKMKIKKLGTQNELVFNSNTGGLDSVLSMRKSYLDTLADYFGITGDSVRCLWRVWAFNGYDSLPTSSPVFLVTLVRSLIGVRSLSSDVPEKFALYNNYPNPFNPSTSIKFDIAKTGHIKISVYDAAGRLAAVLVNENLSAGTFETKWDASAFSSGIYFCRLETNGFSDTRKMVLIK